MAELKWPRPAAYIVSRAMAEDRLSWMREPEALRTVPLYTKEQVEQVLRAHGVTEGDVVVTKNPDGQIVAVTRQDDEGRILKIIAQSTDGVREGGKP